MAPKKLLPFRLVVKKGTLQQSSRDRLLLILIMKKKCKQRILVMLLWTLNNFKLWWRWMVPPLNVFPAENLELISFEDDKYFMRKGLEGQGGRRSKVGDKVIETPVEKTKAEGKGIAKSIAKPTRSSPSLAPRKMDQGGGGLIILSDDSVMEPVESCTSISAGK
ncbi:hypothetical protein AMTR_s00748p00008810, partial [Amborella trichopoda]